MAVNTITFGGVNSSSYGIYISGEGVFNAPVRDAEVISIPGRNGSFLLDNGRYENIEVTYPAFNTATDKATFIANIDAFRNAIASQKGYQRLEDTFHADEYRMASFIGGLEINPILYNDHTSQFEIVFNCKPQRWLKSGETAVSISNNGTITNPTLFDAHPLVQFKATGGGTLSLGTESITFLNSPVGVTPLSLTTGTTTASGYDPVEAVTINNTTVYNTGDPITLSGMSMETILKPATGYIIADGSLSNKSGLRGNLISATSSDNKKVLRAVITSDPATFTAGTSSTVTHTMTVSVHLIQSGTHSTSTGTITLAMTYNGSNQITIKWQMPTLTGITYSTKQSTASYTGVVDSSKNTITGDIYIDLDIGEAYKIENNNTVSLNNFVNLGGVLPALHSGTTTITYSNTFNTVKITPRWWKI